MYIIKIVTKRNKTGYFTGDSFDSLKSHARRIKTIREARQLHKSLKLSDIDNIKSSEIIKITPSVKKRNPISGSKTRRKAKAARLFESFTGHDAKTVTTVKLPAHDVGLKIGKCLGIMYETVRDGKKESYIHEFKRSSMPLMCVSHDGEQLYLIGGNYIFKDSGINDI